MVRRLEPPVHLLALRHIEAAQRRAWEAFLGHPTKRDAYLSDREIAKCRRAARLHIQRVKHTDPTKSAQIGLRCQCGGELWVGPDRKVVCCVCMQYHFGFGKGWFESSALGGVLTNNWTIRKP